VGIFAPETGAAVITDPPAVIVRLANVCALVEALLALIWRVPPPRLRGEELEIMLAVGDPIWVKSKLRVPALTAVAPV
jgi:hypothetical protein